VSNTVGSYWDWRCWAQDRPAIPPPMIATVGFFDACDDDDDDMLRIVLMNGLGGIKNDNVGDDRVRMIMKMRSFISCGWLVGWLVVGWLVLSFLLKFDVMMMSGSSRKEKKSVRSTQKSARNSNREDVSFFFLFQPEKISLSSSSSSHHSLTVFVEKANRTEQNSRSIDRYYPKEKVTIIVLLG